MLRILLGCAILTACSGGGGGNGSSVPGPGTQVAVNNGDPGNYAIHYVIEDGAGDRGFDIVPAGSNEDASFQPQPAPGVLVTYPDGSQQVSASDGTFNPATNGYVNTNLATFETNPNAAPYVTVTDPSGRTFPLYTQLDASWLGLGNTTALSASGRRTTSATTASLSSISIRPGTANALSGALVPVAVVGLDSDGNLENLSGFSITWSANAGSISTVSNSPSALYRAPAAGSGYDAVTAVVSVPNSGATFSASANIAYFDASNAVQINGSVSPSKSLPAASLAVFMQRQNVPAVFGPYFWFAPLGAGGTFTALLPKNVSVTPLVQGPFGNGVSYETLTTPAGGPTFATSALSSNSVAFTLPIFGGGFTPPTPAPAPPVSSYISDAWNSSAMPASAHVFDADSGLQQAPSWILSNPTPQQPPAPIPSGLLAGWSYQWSVSGDSYVLTLAEAANGTPGTHTVAITVLGNGKYSYVRYVSPNPVSTASPLAAVQQSSALESSGSWTQSGSTTGTYTVNATVSYYSATKQSLGAPEYTENLTYTRNASGTATFQPDTLFDASGRALWSVISNRSASNSSAYGTTGAVFSYTGSLSRYYYLTNGQQSSALFDLAGTANGDGSVHATFANHATGQSVAYDLVPPAAATSVRAQNGVVTDPNLSPSVVATFTISASEIVSATAFADPSSGFPGNLLSFSL